MYKPSSLSKCVKQMRSLGEILIPYNFPMSSPKTEDIITPLKQRLAFVDGYEIVLHYSKADYNDHYLETFQTLGHNFPHLPFSLVCKCAVIFLGSKELSLTELWQEERNIYIWTLTVDKGGHPLPTQYEDDAKQLHSYNGLEFSYVDPKYVNFF